MRYLCSVHAPLQHAAAEHAGAAHDQPAAAGGPRPARRPAQEDRQPRGQELLRPRRVSPHLDSNLHHDILPLYRPETVHLVLTLANELKLYGERFAWFAGTKVIPAVASSLYSFVNYLSS